MPLNVGATVTAGQESAWHPRLGEVTLGIRGPVEERGLDRINIAPATFTLAALRDRADHAYSLARAERNESGGDPSHGDPERLRKLYPPYPDNIRERAAYVEGLAQVDAALMPPGLGGDDLAQRMAERLSTRLAQRPEATLSRRTAADLITNLESEA